MKQVVIIGQNYSTSLGLIRSFGEDGYECFVARCAPGSTDYLKHTFTKPDIFSCYVKKAISIDRKAKQHVVDRLIKEFSAPPKKKILVPADDYSAALISEFSDEFNYYFHIPDLKNKSYNVDYVMSKNRQKEIAKFCGMNVAKNQIVCIEKNKEFTLSQNIEYPCMLKPLASVGLSKAYIQRCDTQEQLTQLLKKISTEQSCQLLIEQFIPVEKEFTIPGISNGTQVYIPAFLEKTLISEGEHKGVTIQGIVRDSSEFAFIHNQLIKLIQFIKFDGIFDIEILLSNGKYFLNEINFRNGAAAYALTKAGINLPAIWAMSKVNDTSLQMSKSIVQPLTFVSEKAAYEYMLAGYCSKYDYKKICKSADISLIRNKHDWKSAIAFELLKFSQRIKKWTKKNNLKSYMKPYLKS